MTDMLDRFGRSDRTGFAAAIRKAKREGPEIVRRWKEQT
jgi:hypothetical protein